MKGLIQLNFSIYTVNNLTSNGHTFAALINDHKIYDVVDLTEINNAIIVHKLKDQPHYQICKDAVDLLKLRSLFSTTADCNSDIWIFKAVGCSADQLIEESKFDKSILEGIMKIGENIYSRS